MNILHYILVDDDPVNNLISTIEIESIINGTTNIKTFEVPELALEFILHNYNKNSAPTILFLDINMPTLSGWEFMEEYDKFNEEIKNQIRIYILSSSVDPSDRDKALANNHVNGFISKPLESETLLSIAGY